MFQLSPARRLATVGGALLATTASVLTFSVSAQAVPGVPKQASAQAFSIGLLGQTVPSDSVYAQWTTRGIRGQEATAPVVDLPGNQTLVSGGVSAAKAAAANGIAYGCSGIVAKGGSLDFGSGYTCQARNTGSGGVAIDLGRGLTALPVGIGYVTLGANAITATARFTNDGKVAGNGKIANLKLTVCVGATIGGTCVNSPVVVPVKLKGTANENVLAVITDLIAKDSALTAVATGLSSALSGALTLTSNVQSATPNGGKQFIGLQLTLLGGNPNTTNLAIAQAGPLVTS